MTWLTDLLDLKWLLFRAWLADRFKKSTEELREEAEAGDALAQLELGHRYARGDGCTTNFAQAVTWYRKSADQGYDKAQHRLGHMYYFDIDLKDNTEAAKWWRKAAEQGYSGSQFKLGFLYNNGDHFELMTFIDYFPASGITKAQVKNQQKILIEYENVISQQKILLKNYEENVLQLKNTFCNIQLLQNQTNQSVDLMNFENIN